MPLYEMGRIRFSASSFNRLSNNYRTLDLKNTTKLAGSRGISPETVNGLALAASSGGRWVWSPTSRGSTEAGLLTAGNRCWVESGELLSTSKPSEILVVVDRGDPVEYGPDSAGLWWIMMLFGLRGD